MEKINIAEILKDCPKGMELDCTMYNNVKFDYVEQNPESIYPIHCLMGINGGYTNLVFTHYGCNDRHPNAKCVIFPKGKTTWEGFQRPFKDGDIVVAEDDKLFQIFIVKEVKYYKNNYYNGYCYFGWNFNSNELFNKGLWGFNRLATEEEKQKLFDVIKENGYTWNPETKILKKLIVPKFKVKDKIKNKINKVIYTIKAVGKNIYTVEESKGKFSYYISFNEEENYELVPNKFDITTLKPFESKVLVRSSMDGLWKPAVFGFRNGYNDNAFYIVGGSCWKQCIPYLNNEHLCGTTNDCDDYYKTWK